MLGSFKSKQKVSGRGDKLSQFGEKKFNKLPQNKLRNLILYLFITLEGTMPELLASNERRLYMPQQPREAAPCHLVPGTSHSHDTFSTYIGAVGL